MELYIKKFLKMYLKNKSLEYRRDLYLIIYLKNRALKIQEFFSTKKVGPFKFLHEIFYKSQIYFVSFDSEGPNLKNF